MLGTRRFAGEEMPPFLYQAYVTMRPGIGGKTDSRVERPKLAIGGRMGEEQEADYYTVVQSLVRGF